MVALNDEIMTKLTDKGFEGVVSLGVPHDIVYPVVSKVLQQFRAQFPNVQVDLRASFTSYCRVWCLKVLGHAAIWSGFWVSIPSLNWTPVMTLAR